MSSTSNKIGLNIRIEECLIRAPNGLRIEIRVALLHVIEQLRFGSEDEPDIAFHRMRFPDLRMRIGPARELAGHLRARRHGAIHAERSESAEQRTIEQRPPARIENAGGAAGAGNQIP